jgi:D-3-phosphoglycerate dehydrogenase
MRVLVADSLDEGALGALTSSGHDCTVEPDLGADDLPGRISGFEALVVRSTKVTAACIEAGDVLMLVVRAGAGTNTIDTEAAAARGVFVANVPGRNAIAVAELTMGLLLAVDRRIPDNVAALRAGRWDKKTFSKAAGLYGSSMAVIGLGDIGLAVAERAAAFGIALQVLKRDGRDRRTEKRIDRLGARRHDSLESLVRASDIVSLHVPAAPDTRGLVDETFLSWMRPGSMLLNTSRGDVVDEAALLAALDEKELWAGVDVYADEPAKGRADWTSKLAQHPRVVGTHHIGASTAQAQRAVAAGVVEVIEAFATGQAPNCVNLAPRLGSASLTVRHLDRVGVLAKVLDVLSRARLNVEHMENRVFSGGEAAVATIDLSGAVAEDVVAEIGRISDVLSVSVVSLGAESA